MLLNKNKHLQELAICPCPEPE